jgi:hypothetical protein
MASPTGLKLVIVALFDVRASVASFSSESTDDKLALMYDIVSSRKAVDSSRSSLKDENSKESTSMDYVSATIPYQRATAHISGTITVIPYEQLKL